MDSSGQSVWVCNVGRCMGGTKLLGQLNNLSHNYCSGENTTLKIDLCFIILLIFFFLVEKESKGKHQI